MNPLLDAIVRDLATGVPASALPGAPVVPHTPTRTAILRHRTGSALHAVARRIEPRDGDRLRAVRRAA